MFNITDNSKIGIFMVMAGLSSYSVGLLFFFDRSLLLLGNILFLVGIRMLIGFMGSVSFFVKRGKLKGSLFYFFGLFVIIIKFAFIGAILQLYGIFILFYSFFPHLFEWVLSVPLIGPFLKHNRFFNYLMNSIDNRKKANI